MTYPLKQINYFLEHFLLPPNVYPLIIVFEKSGFKQK